MNTLVDMISGMEVKEDDEDFMNAVDYMFSGLEKRKPDCFAVKQYKKYKLASGKTAKSILISCGARLAPFDIPQLREIMSYDELELDRIGDRKTAVFFIISDTTQTYNFLVALAFSQMTGNMDVLHVDLSPVRELVSLQRRCSNNLNQVAIQANTYGGIYPEEIASLQRDYAALWEPLADLLKKLAAVVEL